jgi:hypothetical protein
VKECTCKRLTLGIGRKKTGITHHSSCALYQREYQRLRRKRKREEYERRVAEGEG